MIGPGKYDNLATMVRKQANADGIILIVFNGSRGNGFSVQCDLATLQHLPELLENVAAQIRADRKEDPS